MPKRKCSSVVVSFGQNLVYYRKKSGYTQQQVADKLNLNRTTYTKYETSVSEPSIEIMLKIADIFGVQPEQLLQREISIGLSDSDIKITSENDKKLLKNFQLLNTSQKQEIFDMMSKFIIENNKK